MKSSNNKGSMSLLESANFDWTEAHVEETK